MEPSFHLQFASREVCQLLSTFHPELLRGGSRQPFYQLLEFHFLKLEFLVLFFLVGDHGRIIASGFKPTINGSVPH